MSTGQVQNEVRANVESKLEHFLSKEISPVQLSANLPQT